MKNSIKIIALIMLVAVALGIVFTPIKTMAADADEAVITMVGSNENDVTMYKAIGASIAVGLAAMGGALGMGLAVGRSAEGVSRQPEASGKIQTLLMLGLVFIETAIIYALIVAILVVFVL